MSFRPTMVPSTARQLSDPHGRERLAAFARFLRATRLEAFADAQLVLQRQLEIPLLRLFAHLGDAELRALVVQGAEQFLADLEAGRALEVATQSLAAWEADELPGIPKDSVEASDLVLVYVAQERALQAFLPEFATDVPDALAIAAELRAHYAAAQDEAFKLFTRMRAEAAEREIAQGEELVAQSEELAAQSEELALQRAELLEANEELVRQRAMLGGVLDHVPGAVGYCDRDLVIRVVNERYAEQFHARAEDLVGRHVRDAVPDMDPDVVVALKRVLETGQPLHSYGVPVPGAPAGAPRFQDVTIVPVFDDAGAASGLLSLAVDVSDRLRLEREVERHASESERNRSLLERIVSQAPIGMAYLDAGLVIRRVNPAFLTMFDASLERFLDQPYLMGTTPEVRTRLDAALRDVLATGEPHHSNAVPYHTGHGQTFWDFTYVPAFDRDGKPEGILVFTREVSERVERERLQASQIDQLKQLDRMKDEFLGALSYQLGTPINTVLGFAAVLDEGAVGGALKPEQRAYLQRIIATSQVQLALVNDLLDMSRLSGGRFRLNLGPTDVAGLAARVLTTLGPLIEQQGQRPITYLPEGLPLAQADEQRVEQVLTSLLHGAIRLSPPGGLIRVQVEAQEGAVRCEVQDSGTPIDAETAERIFERYTQVGGTWLGLAIAKRIVEAHGGTIGIDSRPGDGNKFWFTLPQG